MLNQKFITTFKCIVIHLVREGKKDSCNPAGLYLEALESLAKQVLSGQMRWLLSSKQ